MEQRGFKILFLILLCISIFPPSFAFSDSVEYLYDDLSRLVRITGSDNTRILYQYDEVGNLISISKETSPAQPLPPVLQGIDPDIFLISKSYNVTITGQNLLTTSSITSDNPNITIKNIAAIDTKIQATISIANSASPVQANLTVTTSYGSASMTINLYEAIVVPEALSLFTGITANTKVSLNPSATKDFKASIHNKYPEIINTQSLYYHPCWRNC